MNPLKLFTRFSIHLQPSRETACHFHHVLEGVLDSQLWGTVPRIGNVAQPPLGKASGERGWQAGPTSMDRFSSGKSGLHCTLTAMRLTLAKTPSPLGSKCLLSVFIFLKSELDLPSMEHNRLDHFSLHIANILL